MAQREGRYTHGTVRREIYTWHRERGDTYMAQ